MGVQCTCTRTCVRVSGKGFFSHVTVGLTGWPGEEMTVEAADFTPNVRVQVFSSPIIRIGLGG